MLPVNSKRRGFTFIELLVIIAIVAVMAAILFPVFCISRETCGPPACRSNLMMINTGLAMYCEDYDERFPPAAYTLGIQSVTLPALLQPYLKNGPVWQCPKVARGGDRINTYDGTPADTTVSYGYNWAGLTRNGIGVRTERIGQPADTVALVETTSHLATPPMLIPALGGTAPAYRHNRTLNVAWVDGHATFERPGKLEMVAEEEAGKPTGSGIDRYRYWNLR